MIIVYLQICQADVSSGSTYPIADQGTEQIYIDTDNTVYVYYNSPTNDGRLR